MPFGIAASHTIKKLVKFTIFANFNEFGDSSNFFPYFYTIFRLFLSTRYMEKVKNSVFDTLQYNTLKL